jgi:hypothetical protein
MSAIDTGSNAAEKVVNSSAFEMLARFGYFVRGVLYFLVGAIAVQVAIGARGATEGKGGALTTISAQPFGKVLLMAVVIGLVGYSLWGIVRAVFDPMKKGTDAKGLAQRAGYLVSAVSYGVLVIPAVSIIMGSGDGGDGDDASEQTAFALSQPLGHWLVIIAGLIAMGGAIGQMYLGVTSKFAKDFKKDEMSKQELEGATWVGRVGYVARGVVFLLGGFFLVKAALESDPREARGLDGALAALAGGSFGMPMLLATAIGLAAFGVYSMLCTKWIKLGKVVSGR